MDNIIKGDTYTFTKTLNNYSSATYDFWMVIRGSNQYDIKDGETGVTITPTAGAFVVTVTAATTALWETGSYWWAIYAGLNSWATRYQVESGTLTIKPDLASVSTTYDGRSHVKITLDAIEATIQGRASKDQMSYMIQGRQLSRTPLEDLLKFRDLYKAEYIAEQKQEKINNGLNPGNLIKVKL